MSLRSDVLAAIIGMALATYLCRAGGYAVLRATRPPRFVQAMLQHLPGAIFISFLAPAMLNGGPTTWAGAVVTILTQALFRRLAVSIAAGIATVWLAQGL